MAVVSMKQLLEAGAHFGHSTSRWCPKMRPYIYGSKSGIHIVDLRQTMEKLKEAHDYIYKLSSNGGKILFVGTKNQARPIIKEAAEASNNFFINERWLGGMLTNFNTIRQSISGLRRIEELAGEDLKYPGMIKKEAVKLEKKRKKMQAVLGGIKDMKKMPAALFILDIKKESIALEEANKLGIPVVAVVDTNCIPAGVQYVIPGNDDAVKSISLFLNVIASASIAGSEYYHINSKQARDKAEAGSKKEDKKESAEAASEKKTEGDATPQS